MDAFLPLFKPAGMSSHDAVAFARRVLGQRKAGHAGTLDPDACGVLVVALGRYTRLTEYLLSDDKEYRFEVTFGVATATDDSAGQIVEAIPAVKLDWERVLAAVPQFLGEQEQIPPAVSAIRVEGQRSYDLARRGEAFTLAPRLVRIHSLRLIRFWPGEFPRAMFHAACSKGTYIRSLARDLARSLGTVGHVSFLLRTQAGHVGVEDCLTPEEVTGLAAEGWLRSSLLDHDKALAHLPACRLDSAEAEGVRRGRAPSTPTKIPAGTLVRLVDEDGGLAAVARVTETGVRLEKVFP